MKTSNKGIELIKRNEGLSLTAYLCPAKVWTIGYGHTGGVESGDVVTRAQADELLRADLREAEQAVSRERLSINQNQFDALVSFVFNLGAPKFRSSTLLKRIKADANDWRIDSEFKRWVYGGGRVLPGLVKRRKEEAELYFEKVK